MKVYKETIHYKTYEMIDAMLDASKQKIKKYKTTYKDRLYNQDREFIEICMTSFSFGRTAGHTTGAIEYIKSNKNAFLITSSHSQKSYVIGFKWKCPDIPNRIISITERDNQYFAGKENVELIFDSIMNENDIYNFVVNFVGLCKVGALCKIGS